MIRVLVVDDSAFARKVLRELLAAEPDIEVVGTARDGVDALEKIRDLRPDVVTLDLVMPQLDGLGVLKALGGAASPRVLVVSISDADSDLGTQALLTGAVDLVHKPTALASERLFELGRELVLKVRTAAGAVSPPRSERPAPARPRPAPVVRAADAVEVVVVGTSTGGPHAISRVLAALPEELAVPVVVVVHMPEGYTRSLAERLDRECALTVVEAVDGFRLVPGCAVIARGGMHLALVRHGDDVLVALRDEPSDSLHRPSVDVLFTTAAEAYGRGVLAVVLTGMGDDGLLGSRAVHAAGGVVLAQDEATSVVYGMPRRIHEAGLAAAAVALDDVAAAIVRRVT